MAKRAIEEDRIESLEIGERVGVSLDGTHVYPTLLEDISEDAHLVISVPLYRGIPLIMRVEQEFLFYFFRENGRYSFDARVEEIIMRGPLRLISLIPVSEPRKQQRRNSFRLHIGLPALTRPAGSDNQLNPRLLEDDVTPWEEVLTNNISETGVSLNTAAPYNIGDYLQLKIQFEQIPDSSKAPVRRSAFPPPAHVTQDPDTIKNLDLVAIVRQADSIEYMGTIYRLGAEFLPYPEKQRRFVAKFVMNKQRQLLRTEMDSRLTGGY